MKTVSKASLSALGLGLALSAASGVGLPTPSWAAETCHGLPATIVGTPGATVQGTPGDDVIVTSGATQVLSGDGNDSVCGTGPDLGVRVVAGPGDDYVDLSGLVVTPVDSAAGQAPPVNVIGPGSGADTVIGSAGRDQVVLDGDGPDTVDTGAGNDFVQVQPTLLDDGTTIDLGDGADTFGVVTSFLGSLSSAGIVPDVPQVVGGAALQLDAGRGNDMLDLGGENRYAVDARHQRIRTGSYTMAYRSVDSYQIQGHGHGPDSFRGSNRDEQVTINGGHGNRVSMGGGNDTIGAGVSTTSTRVSHLHGGTGVNTLSVQTFDHTATLLDLASGRYVDHHHVQVLFDGFQNADAIGVHRLRGTDQANILTWNFCWKVTIQGGGGDDVIRPDPDTDAGNCHKPATVHGGTGNDTITGGPDNDHLDAGSGHDRVDGAAGRDVCLEAEVARHCERQEGTSHPRTGHSTFETPSRTGSLLRRFISPPGVKIGAGGFGRSSWGRTPS